MLKYTLIALVFACAIVGDAHALDLKNITEDLKELYQDGLAGIGFSREDWYTWQFIPWPLHEGAYINHGVYYATTLASTGIENIGAEAGFGTTHHTCYAGNVMAPTCFSMHAGTQGSFEGAPPNKKDDDPNNDSWLRSNLVGGTAYVGYLINRIYEVDPNGDIVNSTILEFDDFKFLDDEGKLDAGDLLDQIFWFYTSEENTYDGEQPLRTFTVNFVRGSTGTTVKLQYMFTNTAGVVDEEGAGRWDPLLTAKSMETYIAVDGWVYNNTNNYLAVELKLVTEFGSRMTQWKTDGTNTTSLDEPGDLLVWEAVDADINKGHFFTIGKSGRQGSSSVKPNYAVLDYKVKVATYDESNTVKDEDLKYALHDNHPNAALYLAARAFYGDLFSGLSFREVGKVVVMEVKATLPGAKYITMNPGMGVGPWINPYRTTPPEKPAEANCFDGVINGEETKIDCGGTKCPPCPSCADNKQNQGEEGVDCGGPCAAECDDNGEPKVMINDNGASTLLVAAVAVVVACVAFAF